MDTEVSAAEVTASTKQRKEEDRRLYKGYLDWSFQRLEPIA